MSTYTYYFRSQPDPKKDMPEKMLSMEVHRKPEYNHLTRCDVYGSAAFSRPLSLEEQMEHDLIPDPRNHLAGVMLE
jgi:hypothetical protein